MQEEAIRAWASTLAYRMNLAHARSSDPALVEAERQRFLRALQPVLAHPGPKIIVTDSQVGVGGVVVLGGWVGATRAHQWARARIARPAGFDPAARAALPGPAPQAVDILHPWTLDPQTGEELVPFTTFRWDGGAGGHAWGWMEEGCAWGAPGLCRGCGVPPLRTALIQPSTFRCPAPSPQQYRHDPPPVARPAATVCAGPGGVQGAQGGLDRGRVEGVPCCALDRPAAAAVHACPSPACHAALEGAL